jgi:hypothetical protein
VIWCTRFDPDFSWIQGGPSECVATSRTRWSSSTGSPSRSPTVLGTRSIPAAVVTAPSRVRRALHGRRAEREDPTVTLLLIFLHQRWGTKRRRTRSR